MNPNLPHTPFSTPLSRSARETERRIQNIMTGPQKRPPMPLLILVCSLCLLCGNLVSCQMAEAEAPGASGLENPDSSATSQREDNWQTAELKNTISPDWLLDLPYEICPICLEPLGEHDPEICGHLLVDQIPAEELPREAVDAYFAQRKDYWRDTLLPVAYDPETDFTVYFVVVPDSMPNIGPGVGPELYSLDRAGVVLRLRDHAAYYNWDWGINAKFGSNPLLVVDDFDGDSRPEAALALTWGEGTGCYVQSLYIIELDWGAMSYSTLDCSDIPLEITYDRNKTTARLVSGEQMLEVDISELEDRFDGKMMVGNIIYFYQRDPSTRCEKIETGNGGTMFAMRMQPRLLCELDVDFTGHTLDYMARVFFPVIYEDGVYKLGPAEIMTDDMFAEGQELCERSIQ